MADVIIDANIVSGYFKESIKNLMPEAIGLSGSTIELIDRLYEQNDVIYLDHGGQKDDGTIIDGQIITEWKNQISKIEREWFNYWISDLLEKGRIKYIAPDNCRVLMRRLYNRGFPQRGGDKWYVKTAKAVVNYNGRTFLISEDLDFFDPRQKRRANGQARLDILINCTGPIPPILEENDIDVRCIRNY